MAAKRFFCESEENPDRPPEKRMRPRPSFASIIREVVMVNSLQNLSSALEPLLRKVVREELERVLMARYTPNPAIKMPSFCLQELEPSSLKLAFAKQPMLPIFTGTKIVDADGCPLQILLLDTAKSGRAALPNSVKVEIIVLDGDFPSGGGDTWRSEEFDKNVVRERTGKRPLLTGDVNVTVRDGSVVIGDVEFTDNSSWIRSRRFRVGARVVSGTSQGVEIREAMTDAFVVKDHRGELYKKHHPPSLDDEVWRLEKIGKDGAFHRKLSADGIKTVQDFLKLSVVDPPRLRSILGAGMSEKMWEVTINHARECVMGSKLYVSKGHDYVIFLNPICQVVRAMINGLVYPTRDLSFFNRRYIEKLVKLAYQNWDSLEQVDALIDETPLLTQGEAVDEYPNINHEKGTIQPELYQSDHNKGVEIHEYLGNNEHEAGCSNWQVGPASAYMGPGPGPAFESGFRFGFVEESPEGDLILSGSGPTFINGG